MVSVASPAMAQLQRSVINTGFELNDPGGPSGGPSVTIYSNSQVVGWETTTGFIELWDSNYEGVSAAEGKVLAEMNANAAGILFQNVCMVNGELMRWRYQHRKRAGGLATQTVRLEIASSAGTVLQTLSSSANTNSTAWTIRDGTGGTVYTGPSGVQRIQFATSDAGSYGNLLDDITLTLSSYLEFQPAVTSSREGQATPTMPSIQVSGNVPTPINVTVNVTGGSATIGTDYSTPNGTNSFVVTIPAGNYGGTQFPIGIFVLDDDIVEGAETINLSITPDPARFTIASTSVCGATANSVSTHTIKDSLIAPVNDSVSGVNGVAGTTNAINAYTNDLFENNPVVVANIVGSVVTPATPIGGGPVPTLDVATGAVVVPAGTPSGSYTIAYQICERADSTNCQTATITVIVSPAADLVMTKSNGVTGVTKGSTVTYTITATNNGPNSATGAVVTDFVGSGLTCAPTNEVTVSSGGSYTVADLTGAGITLGTIANGQSVTLSYPCAVN